MFVDEYAAPEIPEENAAENKDQSLIQDSTPIKPSSFSEYICYFVDLIVSCFNGFLAPEILTPICFNILVWGWMSVMILNYADVIDLPRKNLFGSGGGSSGSSYSSSSWDFGGGGGSGDEGAAAILLIIFVVILVIIIAMLMPLIYPEFIFVLLYGGYIIASYSNSSSSSIGEDPAFHLFTLLTLGSFYQIFYVCYNCGYPRNKNYSEN